MAKSKVQLTEGEWSIIQAIWDEEPCAAPTIQEKLIAERKWSYSTVKTMMDRMVIKGLLKTEKIRNLILYRSAVTRRQAQKSEIMGILTRAFNGALTPMMQFLIKDNDLSADELSQLEELIKQKQKDAASNKK